MVVNFFISAKSVRQANVFPHGTSGGAGRNRGFQCESAAFLRSRLSPLAAAMGLSELRLAPFCSVFAVRGSEAQAPQALLTRSSTLRERPLESQPTIDISKRIR
jgi:hypothetical protein